MANSTHKVTAALAVSATLLTARAASATDTPVKATLVLHVDNLANLPSETLTRTQTLVTAIFAEAGVRMVWIDGRERPPQREGERHLKVLLLSREMSEQKITAEGVSANVLARAARVAGRAYIFTHRVEDLATHFQVGVARVLGKVIAHEVGHLLLPGNSHSSTGIMCESLDMKGRPERFSPQQSTSIQEAIVSGN